VRAGVRSLPRILIVDHDSERVRLIQMELDTLEFNVIVADSGRAAL
jgi:hypothetical protein